MANEAVVVGIFVRQGGVWERSNGGGSSDGFDGVNVRQSGVWEEVGTAQAYNSGWNVCWTNIDGELNVGNYSASDFDVSPYFLEAWIDLNSDGSLDRKHNGTTTNQYANWRPYDCGREYEIKSDRTTGGGSFIVEEPLPDNTWKNLTDPALSHRWHCQDSGTGFSFINENWEIRIREKVTAPAGGNDIGNIDIDMDAEI